MRHVSCMILHVLVSDFLSQFVTPCHTFLPVPAVSWPGPTETYGPHEVGARCQHAYYCVFLLFCKQVTQSFFVLVLASWDFMGLSGPGCRQQLHGKRAHRKWQQRAEWGILSWWGSFSWETIWTVWIGFVFLLAWTWANISLRINLAFRSMWLNKSNCSRFLHLLFFQEVQARESRDCVANRFLFNCLRHGGPFGICCPAREAASCLASGWKGRSFATVWTCVDMCYHVLVSRKWVATKFMSKVLRSCWQWDVVGNHQCCDVLCTFVLDHHHSSSAYICFSFDILPRSTWHPPFLSNPLQHIALYFFENETVKRYQICFGRFMVSWFHMFLLLAGSAAGLLDNDQQSRGSHGCHPGIYKQAAEVIS